MYDNGRSCESLIVTLTTLHNPFNISDREIKTLEVENGLSVENFLSRYTTTRENSYHAVVNGHVIPEYLYNSKILDNGDYVAICPVIGKGNGKNPLALLAGLALSIFSFGVVSPFVSGLVGGGFMGSVAGNIAAGLTLMGGGQLISNAFSPDLNYTHESGYDSTSYQWGELQSISQQGAVIPITYGTIRTAGQVLNQHVKIVDDSEYLEILLCGGEGPIVEFTDVRINDNPIENFDDAAFYTRDGFNTESVIEGFGSLYDTQTVGVYLDCGEENPNYNQQTDSGLVYLGNDESSVDGRDLTNTDITPLRNNNLAGTESIGYFRSSDLQLSTAVTNNNKQPKYLPGEWYTIELTGDIADSVEVFINFPEGLAWYGADTPSKTWVRLTFEYSEYNSLTKTWNEWVKFVDNELVQECKTAPFAITKRINRISAAGVIPQAFGKLRIRGRCDCKSSKDDIHARNKVYWSTVSAIVKSEFTHPNKALMAVEIKASEQLNNGIPTITWKQTRDYVWVRENGQWVMKDAQNPAWIIYDLIVGCRLYDGIYTVTGLDPARIDYNAFKAWAQWNDKPLDNRPAMRMNLYVDEQKSLWQWINDIAVSARGAVVLRGTKISCIFDAPSEPVQMFTMANILAGSFSGEFLPVEDRANAIEISFYNEAKNYEREQITVYATDFDNSDARINPISIELTGITDFERAYREGEYRLNQNKYILRTVSFSADIDAIACQPGDVILIQHDIPQWSRGGRITEVYAGWCKVNCELDLSLDIQYSMMIRLKDDKIITRQCRLWTSSAIMLDTKDLTPGDVFIISEIGKTAKPFRVQSIARTGDLQANITCTEYIPELYTQHGNIPVIDYTDTQRNVTDLTIFQNGYYNDMGIWQPELWASWNYVGERPAQYEYKLSCDNGVWTRSSYTTDIHAQIPIRQDISLYKICVRALYISGLPSEWSYADFNASNLITQGLKPPAPSSLKVTGWFGFANLEWVNPIITDLSHVEIYEATQNDLTTAIRIGTSKSNKFTRLYSNNGEFWYWVRAVTISGLKSDFNSIDGTACVINSQGQQDFLGTLIKDNPYLNEILDDLSHKDGEIEDALAEVEDEINSALESILDNITRIDADITDIKLLDKVTIPDLTNRVKDNENIIHEKIINSLEVIGHTLLVLDHEANRDRNIFRWAGMEIDEEAGIVNIKAVETLRNETSTQYSEVSQVLDAQRADINLKASRIYVNQVAANLISSMLFAAQWEFNNSLDNWTAEHATLTTQQDSMLYTITDTNPAIISPDIAIDGKVNGTIFLQLQQTSGKDNSYVKIQYKTATHGYSDNHSKTLEILGTISVARTIQVDMHKLTKGNDDWENSTITGIKIFIGSSVDATYEILTIGVGQSMLNDTAMKDLEMRVTQAEIDIDGANAAIALKASELTVQALSQRLSQAEIDIDGANAAIDLKASITELTETQKELKSAELRINAAEGVISQNVEDVKLLRGELGDTQVALAQAKTELTAKIDEEGTARAGLKTELTAAIDDSASTLRESIDVVADDVSAQGTLIEQLQSDFADASAAITTEAKTRADADSAEAEKREALQAQLDNQAALIEEVSQVTATESEVQANRMFHLQAQLDLESESDLWNTLHASEAQERRRVAVADAREEYTALVTEDRIAMANYQQELIAKIDDNDAIYKRDIQTVANELSAEVTLRENLQATVTKDNQTIMAAIETEKKARADADSAEASARQTLAAVVGDSNSGLVQQVKVNANKISASAESLTALQSTVGDSKSGLVQKLNTTANTVSAHATSLTALKATVGDEKSGLVQAANTLKNTVDVDHETLTAHAKSINTLSASVGDSQKGMIKEVSDLKVTMDKVTGRKYVKIDSNGYVAGYELYNGGSSDSSFTVKADSFNIYSPKDKKKVFNYDSNTGKLTIDNLDVQQANVSNITITNSMLIDNSVTINKIANGAVSVDKIADGAVSVGKIADGAVSVNKIADGAVSRKQFKSATPNITVTSNAWVTPINISLTLSANTPVMIMGTLTLTNNLQAPYEMMITRSGSPTASNSTLITRTGIITNTTIDSSAKSTLPANISIFGIDMPTTGATFTYYIYIRLAQNWPIPPWYTGEPPIVAAVYKTATITSAKMYGQALRK